MCCAGWCCILQAVVIKDVGLFVGGSAGSNAKIRSKGDSLRTSSQEQLLLASDLDHQVSLPVSFGQWETWAPCSTERRMPLNDCSGV